MAKKIDYTNAYTAYEDAMTITDDTRLDATFGNDLIWRDRDAEHTVEYEKSQKARSSHERIINLFAFIAVISYVIGAPIIASMTHSFSTGMLTGLTPYFTLTAYSLLKRDDTFFWQLLPLMFTSIVGCFIIFIHTALTLLYSLHV